MLLDIVKRGLYEWRVALQHSNQQVRARGQDGAHLPGFMTVIYRRAFGKRFAEDGTFPSLLIQHTEELIPREPVLPEAGAVLLAGFFRRYFPEPLCVGAVSSHLYVYTAPQERLP